MKTKTFNKRLILNKRTVADLNNREMSGVHGGFVSYPPECNTNATNCAITRCASQCPECPPAPGSTDPGCFSFMLTECLTCGKS